MPSIKIDRQILAEWSRLAAEGLTDLDMPLSSATAADECIAAINDAVNALVAEHNTTIEATRPTPGQEPPWPGEWHMVELADGSVGVRVLECERADVFVPTVVDALERAGIAGKLTSLRWPVAPTPPSPALVLELKMLVRGHRFHKRGRAYGWAPDRSSRDWLIELAATWLRNSGNEGSAPALTVSVLPTVSLAPSDDVAARILGNLDELNHIDARIATGSGFRIITWAPNTQQVGLIHVSDREWEQPLVGLQQALVDAAGRIVYGYIKRENRQLRLARGTRLRMIGGHGTDTRQITSTAPAPPPSMTSMPRTRSGSSCLARAMTDGSQPLANTTSEASPTRRCLSTPRQRRGLRPPL